MRKIIILVSVAVAFLALQLVRKPLENPPVTGDFSAPAEVKAIIKRSCYNCHSNETELPWYDQLAPAYWLVRSHVTDGRSVLNFSSWDSLSVADQKSKLFASINKILFHEMPVREYTWMHPSSVISEQEIDVLKNYLKSMSPEKQAAPEKFQAMENHYTRFVSEGPKGIEVTPSPNGIAYMPEYKNWGVISTTDRFDNGTMRVILGNAIAVNAVRNHQVNPWPDGAILAKVAWEQLIDSTGYAHTGEFKQVEFMIKDSRKYATTAGWGWARWKGMQLLPYGKNELFTQECVQCHNPMRKRDFVFTSPAQ
ncbi:MAG TPA: heme-binding domain-containing protein [Ohtaekwangia sp.]|uniref:heme-binding domain-containing protein n=1 Tax=Ohtaekwangia sp. TaxID=2066019 RepID=UPI002F92A9D6